METKSIAKNRKAEFEYFLLEHFESGIALHGSEIKSIRAGQVSLQEAYVEVKEDSAWLVEAHIANYNPASYNNHDPKRNRQLLLHKKEIRKLWDAVRQKGVTVVPVKMYFKEGRAKLDIAIAKGKKLYDKRDDLAQKDITREIARALKGRD
ncbi:MAG: SsrA-binding protein SmpB [Anaerolineae bacterium]|jgi:SsrA-binding protein|nr:SsrA-binding protein SmpB [Anaerolineae bacterium]MDO9120526.1 SsrA-binding protein SmpB [Anaerolineaceae bacterium]